jgi:hypothetical protein
MFDRCPVHGRFGACRGARGLSLRTLSFVPLSFSLHPQLSLQHPLRIPCYLARFYRPGTCTKLLQITLKGGGEYQAPLASSINKRLFNMAHRISDGTDSMPIFQMLGLNKRQMDFVRSLSACLSFRFSEIVPGDNGWIKCLILLCTRVAQSLGSGSHLGLLRSPIPSRPNDSHIRRFPATEALCVFHGQRKKLAIALQSYRVTCGDFPSRPWIRFHTVQRPCVTDTAR